MSADEVKQPSLVGVFSPEEDCANTRGKAQIRSKAVATALSGVDPMVLLVWVVQIGQGLCMTIFKSVYWNSGLVRMSSKWCWKINVKDKQEFGCANLP